MRFYTNINRFQNKLYIVGYDNSKPFYHIERFQPELFLLSKEHSEYKNPDNQYLKKLDFESMSEASKFGREYSGIEGYDIYGTSDWVSQYIIKNYPKELNYNIKELRIFFFDIEVNSSNGFPEPEFANEPVTAISLYDNKLDKIIVFANKDYKVKDSDVIYKKFENEELLLFDFVSYWKDNMPNIVSGWNSLRFDMPYIINRLEKLTGNNKLGSNLSPFKKYQKQTTKNRITGKEDEIYEIFGVSQLDYLDLFKKYSPKQMVSYKLDHIGEEIVGEKKVEYEGSLHELYENDYEKFIDYSIQDTRLLKKIDAKMKLIDLIISISYLAGLPCYEDVFGVLKMWENIIYRDMYYNKVIDKFERVVKSKTKKYEGAFVKTPIKSKAEWIVSEDFASYYPLTIVQNNIGWETLVTKDKLMKNYNEIRKEMKKRLDK